jgi:dTDP-glucose pyrophosphorylase
MRKDRLSRCIAEESATIRETMVAIDHGAVEIAFIRNQDGKIIGTCTDGDIRRALLGGAELSSPVKPFVQRNFVSVGEDSGRAEVLDLMQARQIQQIPVLDSERRLIGLHLLRELIGTIERPNWAVLMAGGKGMRLRPLTEHLPKPMIPVAGRPILERLVLHLISYGLRRIFISVNYKSHLVEEFFGDGANYGCSIEYLREQEPLGTGGALALLPERPQHPFVVMNGDLVTGINVAEMLNFHERGRFDATIAVREYFHTVPFGTIAVSGEHICEIAEKPTQSWLVNAGTYVLHPDFINRVPNGRDCPITTLLDDAIRRKERVGAYRVLEDWTDVGRVSDLARAMGTSPAWEAN